MIKPNKSLIRHAMCIAFLMPFVVLNMAVAQNKSTHDANVYSHAHTVINKIQLSESFDLDVNKADDYAKLDLNLGNKLLSFELFENDDLYAGQIASSKETVAYFGSLSGSEGTWARFVLFDNKIMGAYYDGENLFIVDRFDRIKNSIAPVAMTGLRSSINNRNLTNSLAVFAWKDVDHDGTCGSEAHSLVSNNSYEALVSELQTSMAGNVSKEINIALVADTEFVAENTNSSGESEASAVMINNLNIASGIFETQFDIQITATVVTELESNILSDGVSLETTDSEVLVRALRDTSAIPNPGLRHLFTGKDLDGSTVGIAFVGSLCRSSSAGVTQSLNGVTAIILAHELGHNFGARHDSNTAACLAPDGGRYIMFPSVSSNIVAEFSSCSAPNIQSAIDSPFNSCIVEIASNPPEIVSTPNTEAKVGVAYAYDADNSVDVTNAGNATFLLEIAPAEMTINSSGVISWTPAVQDIGTVPVQIRVENSDGQDTQFFEINVTAEFINLTEPGLVSYGRNQDKNGSTTIGSTPFDVIMTGNNWKSLAGDYVVTENTVLELSFSSNVESEIHGVGFDNDNEISRGTFFNLFGTQDWGIQVFRYTQNGETVTFKIPVGQFFTGEFDRLVFAVDNDAKIRNADATFSNIRIYEEDSSNGPVSNIDLSSLVFTRHLPGAQDLSGSVELFDDGQGVELVGNKWQKVVIEGAKLLPGSILEFEFKSTQQGEIHGIGFLPGNALVKRLSFQVFGTQDWGIQDFTYTQIGDYQKFTIPVGAYFTQDSDIEMVFIMDHDVANPNANGSFRNIKLINISNTQTAR